MSRFRARPKTHKVHGIIPTALGATGAAALFASTSNSHGYSPIAQIADIVQAQLGGQSPQELAPAGAALVQEIAGNALSVDVWGPIITAAVVEVVAKKTGLRRDTKLTKKWSAV